MKAFERYDVLREANDQVNRNTRYRRDTDLYGTSDFWEIANGQGDCEDYALAKRQLLLERGVPQGDLRLCIVFTETDEGRRRLALKRGGVDICGDHAVLIGKTPIGDWMLDNRFPQLMQLTDTRYVVDRMQVAGATQWEHGEPFVPRQPETFTGESS